MDVNASSSVNDSTTFTTATSSTSVSSSLVILPTNTVTTVTSSTNVVPSVIPIMYESTKSRKSCPPTVKFHISPDKEPSETITRVKFSPKHSSPTTTPVDSPTPTNSPSSVHFGTPDISTATLYDMIIERDGRMDKLHGKVNMIESLLHIKDCVIEGLKNEIQRLQQYTRRYSVNISGIPKPRNEEEGDLQKIVEELITEVNSTTTVADIDKLHRNGRVHGDKQDVIVRFKSHSAKEAFYKARKQLDRNRRIKIQPSLSLAQKELLDDARDYLASMDNVFLDNPPEFVFANVHGDIQVKMKEKCKDGLFVTFNHIDHLTRIISRANMREDSYEFHDTQSSWADDKTAVVSDVSDDDDMGFGLFD